MGSLQTADLVKKAKAKAEKAIQDTLRDGLLTVKVKTTEKVDGRIKPIEKILFKEVPCRLSYASSDTQDKGQTASGQGAMVLYTGKDVLIPPNSTCLVDQYGASYRLKNSMVKSYGCHNEYNVDFEERTL